MVVIFGIIMMLGLLYLLLMIFGGIGEAVDIDVEGAVDGTGIDTLFGLDGPDTGEVSGLGCGVIAAFMAGFGAVGLTGSLLAWSLPVILSVALVFGWGVARLLVYVMKLVFAQQGSAVYSNEDTIGMSARVTINSPAGKTGEAIIEGAQILKYPIQEINGAALKRGDIVEVVDVSGRFLRVKKKH